MLLELPQRGSLIDVLIGAKASKLDSLNRARGARMRVCIRIPMEVPFVGAFQIAFGAARMSFLTAIAWKALPAGPICIAVS